MKSVAICSLLPMKLIGRMHGFGVYLRNGDHFTKDRPVFDPLHLPLMPQDGSSRRQRAEPVHVKSRPCVSGKNRAPMMTVAPAIAVG